MTVYQYCLVKNNQKIYHELTIDGPTLPDSAIIRRVYDKLLLQLREQRFNDLFSQYNNNFSDVEEVKNYLEETPQYTPFANNLELLKRQLASLYEVSNMYQICDIEAIKECQGCLDDQANQLAHMDCNTGCLHDAVTCGCK